MAEYQTYDREQGKRWQPPFVSEERLADYSACDLAYLRHAYTTGERRSFRRVAGRSAIRRS